MLIYATPKHKHPKPTISVTSTSKEFIEYLNSIIPGSVCANISAKKRNANWKQTWIIAWQSHSVVKAICKILQDKLIIKKQQLEIMLEYINVHESIKHNNKIQLTEKERLLHDKMRILNR